MPHFIGSRVAKGRNQTAFKDLYEFNVLPPLGSDYDPLAVLPAFVTPEVEDSHIAEGLARAFGATEPGDIIELTLQEILFDGTIRTFRLPVVVGFATKNRGPEYIQVGLLDLDAYFNMQLRQDSQNPNEQWMEISLKPYADRECTE
jgi:hypothetical protein